MDKKAGTSGPFHLNFDVNGDNKCSNARRACAVIVNYFKHVQRSRRALSILQLTLKFKWNGPLGCVDILPWNRPN
uniref:Uncharacterized protein n=1 Tax=Candidatus Kentrum sp. FM TaxID=2126340 RepID=A0A450THW2_9GAMM|nr:MAG: hypothetical protein BECKFM1743A_GA0114220_104045 [Candidatus Kentron sp. FM]VFJ66751.1 MAG: hypothetical protein BECKFM1743C_GA0114222_104354 [Candidatus Kentron sp. FM]